MQLKCLSLAVGFASLLVLTNRPALAETSIIKDPDRHPHYVFEAEPHFILAPIGKPPLLPGVGFRGTVVLAQEGFIDKINDSVGLGFGVDYTRDNIWIPVVMQWNFWLSEHWSVFGEPGFAFRFEDHGHENHQNRADFTIYAGGRLRLSDRVTLTMRVGYPAFTAGFSFLL
jgi:hypothetical protein